MFRLILTFITIACFQSAIFAQTPTSFSEDRATFIQELETFMSSSRSQKLIEAFENFEEQFGSAAFSDDDFKKMLATSNKMLSLKMNASTYFSQYLQALTALKAMPQPDGTFGSYDIVLNSIIDKTENRKFKPFSQFLKFSVSFFESKYLKYGKSGLSWAANTERFKLEMDDKAPIVAFENLDLIAFRKKDSISIQKTKGIYYPLTKTWKGDGGNVKWNRPSSMPYEVFCELKSYEIDATKPFYKAENAILTYPELFPGKKVVGTLEDKVTAKTGGKEVSYPRFESRDSVLKINEIGKGISYQGGFRLQGTTVYGFGTGDGKAHIEIVNRGNIQIFRADADLFVIKKGEKLSAEGVDCSIYFDQDSIYHPSVNIKLKVLEESMSLTRGKRGNDRNPFYDSYHKINIDVNSIRWELAKDSIYIGGKSVGFTSANKDVTYESFNFFQEADYERLQNIATTNPLTIIRGMADQQGSKFLNANSLATKFNSRFDVSSIQSLLFDLVSKGFVNYDSERQEVEVKEKVFHYTNASMKKVDYDILKILSSTDKTNAVMDLKSKNIITDGVAAIEFSQSQKVAVKPFKKQMVVKENRNMDFDGKMFAGYTIYEGSDFHFDYDKNHIVMDSIRYFDLFVPTEAVDENGDPIAVSIASRLENANGVLLIDAPSNKSGREDIPVFPSFQSKESSFVYYDDTTILSGVYKRDSFYFSVDPFSFNGLDNYQKEDLNFKGKMVSADIFPEFEENLVLIEEEYSLGFNTTTPAQGYPMYRKKGLYNGSISLSHKGFKGAGNLQYLGASLDADDFIFRPKRLTASARRFDLEENRTDAVPFPKAVGIDVSIDWRPYQDSMFVRTDEEAFALFKQESHSLDGTLILTPTGLKGRGEFNWELGRLNSKLMSFGAFSTAADTSNLQIKTFDKSELAFDTKNVNANLDFDKQIGNVKANIEGEWTTMPYNQFQTSLDEFIWDMKGATVTFQNEAILLGDFRSIHPDQDSLIFQGNTAFYDLKTSELKIGGVPFIKSCDAFIYLPDGKVDIRPGGDITEFTDCRIVADTLNKYHKINRATVKLKGRKNYTASGFYEYNVGVREQEIEFKDIIGTRVGKGKHSEKRSVTRADGEVAKGTTFYIDDNIQYNGKISLSAEKKNLNFDGFAKIESPILPNASWFSIEAEADKKNFSIPFKNPKNYDGQPIEAGIYLSKETAKLYPAFLMPKYFRKDRALFEAKTSEQGLFKHDKKEDQFRFGDSTVVLNPDINGNLLSLGNKSGRYTATGKLNIGSGLKYVNALAAGEIKGIVNENTGNSNVELMEHDMEVKAMLGLTMDIPEKLLKIIITDLQSSSFDARPVDYVKDEKFFSKALSTFIDDKKVLDAEVSEMKSLGLDLPEKYNPFAFLFSQLNLKWNSEYQSFINEKDKVGLGAVAGVPINRILKCYLEFKMPSNEDDRIYMYLVSPSEDWYFFSYKGGILSTVSSNTRYNDILIGMKPKELIKKMKDGEFYEIQPLNPNSAQLFVNRIKAAREN